MAISSPDHDVTSKDIDDLHDKAWILLIQAFVNPLATPAESMKKVQVQIGELWDPYRKLESVESGDTLGDSALPAEHEAAAASSSESSVKAALVPAKSDIGTANGLSSSLHNLLAITAAGATKEGAGPSLITPSPSVLAVFALQLKAFLYGKFAAGFGDEADCGYHSLYETVGKKSLVFSAGSLKKLKLFFIGDIVDEAVTGSLKIGTCFGKDWFVRAPVANQFHTASSHYIVPAWHVPVIKAKAVPTMKCDKVNLDFVFVFDPANAKATRRATMPIEVHYLELVANAKGDVALARDNMADMIKTPKVMVVKKGVIAAKWKPFIHLLQ